MPAEPSVFERCGWAGELVGIDCGGEPWGGVSSRPRLRSCQVLDLHLIMERLRDITTQIFSQVFHFSSEKP
jgi:hypothetical protein